MIMQSALPRLAEALRSVTIVRPRIPVLSNVDAQPHWDPEDIRETLARQVVSPVRWEATIHRLRRRRNVVLRNWAWQGAEGTPQTHRS